MTRNIKDIKKDLKRWKILEESYQAFETNIPENDKIWNCTINDYLSQIWINVKMEVHKIPPRELLPLIPDEQKWFKKMLIKMMLGRPVPDFSPIANALASCEPVSEAERDYIHLIAPIRERSRCHTTQLNVKLCTA